MLALIAYDEIYRILWFKYIVTIVKDNCDYFSNCNTKEKKRERAIKLSRGFMTYVQYTVTKSQDKCLQYTCRFFLIMFKFELYLKVSRNGDTVTMEMIENELCGVFLILDKTNYVELCLKRRCD